MTTSNLNITFPHFSACRAVGTVCFFESSTLIHTHIQAYTNIFVSFGCSFTPFLLQFKFLISCAATIFFFFILLWKYVQHTLTHSKTQWTCLPFFALSFSLVLLWSDMFFHAHKQHLQCNTYFFLVLSFTPKIVCIDKQMAIESYIRIKCTYIYLSVSKVKRFSSFFLSSVCFALCCYAVHSVGRSVAIVRSVRSFLQPKIVAMLFGVPRFG